MTLHSQCHLTFLSFSGADVYAPRSSPILTSSLPEDADEMIELARVRFDCQQATATNIPAKYVQYVNAQTG